MEEKIFCVCTYVVHELGLALWKLCIHFFSNWMGYDRDDSFPFDFEPNAIPFGSKSKGKLFQRSYPIQFERKWNPSFSVYCFQIAYPGHYSHIFLHHIRVNIIYILFIILNICLLYYDLFLLLWAWQTMHTKIRLILILVELNKKLNTIWLYTDKSILDLVNPNQIWIVITI